MLLSTSSFESGAGLSNPPGRARLLFELYHGGDAEGGLRAGGEGGCAPAERSGVERRGAAELQHHGERRAGRGAAVCLPASPSVRLRLHRGL